MKNIWLVTLLTTFLFTSCNMYQDVTFKENGAVSYKMMVDMTEMMQMAPNAAESLGEKGLNKDTTVSLIDFIKDNAKKDKKELSKEQLSLLKDVENLFLQVTTGEDNSEFKFSIFGDFSDADDLNKSLAAMKEYDTLMEDKKDKKKKNDMFSSLANSDITFKWDGKTMQSIMKSEKNEEEELSDKDISLMNSMFSGGKAKISYHFPQRVKNVSNPDAVFSQDGKTVILNYSFTEMLKSAANQNITIEVE